MHYPASPPELPTVPQVPEPMGRHRALGMSMAFVGALIVMMALAFSLAATISGARLLAYPQPRVGISYGAGGEQPRIGQPIQFRAMTQAGTNLTYSWHFGDGGTASGQTPSHTFQKYGRMTVALTVRDPLGQTATVQTAVSILPPKPSACFHFHQGASLAVAFDGSCSSGTQLRYSWSFGDSSAGAVSGKAATSHTFAEPGTFTVTLQVTDAANQTATTSASVTVTIPAPTARFTWQADQFLTATFDASASTGAQLSYSWDYGDGQSDPDAGPRTTHFYSFPGTYTVTLTVTDSFGRSATSHQTVTVSGF